MMLTSKFRVSLEKSLTIRSMMIVFLIGIGFSYRYAVNLYQMETYPPKSMGKYEQIAFWSHEYHRWVAVTPPDYAKVFLPTSSY